MLNGLDLFSGLGGIAEALDPWVRVGAYCEKDRFAQAVLLSRMGRREISTAPIWDDITTLCTGWRLPFCVDIITGGWPCQGNSVAGLRKGMDDERSALVIEVCRLVGLLRPSFVFLENVPGVLTAYGDGVGYVLQQLAPMGYDFKWTMLSAAEVGATHKRERFWLLAHRHGAGWGAGGGLQGPGHAEQPGAQVAHTNSDGRSRLRQAGRGKDQREQRKEIAWESGGLVDAEGFRVGRDGRSVQHQKRGPEFGFFREPDGASQGMGDAGGGRRSGERAWRTGEESEAGYSELGNTPGPRQPRRECGPGGAARDESGRPEPGGRCSGLANAEGQRLPKRGGTNRHGSQDAGPECVGLPRRPPPPNKFRAWREILSSFPEVEPAVCGVAARIPYRNHRIRTLGNSVDVVCAQEAFKTLMGVE